MVQTSWEPVCWWDSSCPPLVSSLLCSHWPHCWESLVPGTGGIRWAPIPTTDTEWEKPGNVCDAFFFSSEYDWLTSGKKVKGACSKNKHLYLYKDALWYSDNLQILQCFCTNQMVLFKNRTVCAAEQSWAATHPECLEFHLKISLKILVQRDQSCGLGQTAPTTLRRMAGLGCQRGWYQSFCCCQLCLV